MSKGETWQEFKKKLTLQNEALHKCNKLTIFDNFIHNGLVLWTYYSGILSLLETFY